MKTVLCLPLLLAAGLAQADVFSQLKQCKGIADAGLRLACYDQLADEPAQAAAPTPAVEDDQPVTPDTINAHLLDDIKGWKRGTQLRLDNGQLWQVTSEGEVRTKLLSKPQVTLHKSWLGYWMTVEGVSTKSKVFRVE